MLIGTTSSGTFGLRLLIVCFLTMSLLIRHTLPYSTLHYIALHNMHSGLAPEFVPVFTVAVPLQEVLQHTTSRALERLANLPLSLQDDHLLTCCIC